MYTYFQTRVLTIERSLAFKRDYKRAAKGRHRTTLDDALRPVIVALASNRIGHEARYRDHGLSAIGQATESAMSPPTCC